MKIIIAGCGKVGSALAQQLSAEGYDLTLIDVNWQVLQKAVDRYDVMAVHGNCAAKKTLQEAEIRSAELLIAVTDQDEMNLLCCMTAHGMNPDLHTIARIRNPEYTDQIYEMRDIFALSMTFNPERQAAAEVDRLLKYPGFLRRDTFAKGGVEIVELRVQEGSKLCNVALRDLRSIIKCKVLVCAVLRDNRTVAPDGSFTLQAGDRIFVTAPTRDLTTLLRSLGVLTHKAKRVMICGGGRFSFYLAQLLQRRGVGVKIIDHNPEQCRRLAELLPEVTIVEGNAGSQPLLDSEGIADCDALVTSTGMDELNMIISLYGSSKNVPQIVTKLGHMEQGGLLDGLQLGSVIYPKKLCSDNIVRYVRAISNQTGAAVAMHSIADGQAEAIEFRVDEHTRNCGKPLKDIQLKRNVLVVCIGRGAQMEIPNGDSSFREGDTVIVVSSGEQVIYHLNDIFA